MTLHDVFTELPWPGDDEAELRRIGQYQILRQIGQGGMGTVYLAARDDDQYKKRVAIKIVRRGMDTEAIQRRFKTERQILASLDHPNIARLLDGGTTPAGRPYFVMEHVDGLPLHEYCDRHRLATLERLKLFRMVCSAVQYAHQNLVVHRDIKPKNILVTTEGVPKLLDFGIAKLLKPELYSQPIQETLPSDVLLTPEYASPEQARGDAVTTATDVYSLGVVLYELLTGHGVHRLKGLPTYEVVRLICEGEPTKPSSVISRVDEVRGDDGAPASITVDSVSKNRGDEPRRLRKRLAGDLDNIVLKALCKEAQRRYASVEQFSDDVRRHLEGLPVSARPSTFSYRAGKFIRRHRMGVVAAAIVAASIVAGIVSTLHQAHLARAQRARAERRFNDVRKLASSFMFEFHDAIENLPGSTKARELLVKRALEYLDSLAAEAGDDPSLERELATAYEKVGDVQGSPFGPSLGDTVGALASYRKALTLREALSAGEPLNAELQGDLAKSYVKLGDTEWVTGEKMGALKTYRVALAINERRASAMPDDPARQGDLSNTHTAIGDVLEDTGDWAGSLEHYRKALAIDKAVVEAGPVTPQAQRELAVSLLKVGDALARAGDSPGALANLRESVTIFETLSAAEPTNARIRQDLAAGYQKLGDAVLKSGDLRAALGYHRKALALCEWLAAADPKNAMARRGVVVSQNRVGDLLDRSGDAAGALAMFGQALVIAEASLVADPTNSQARRDMAVSYYGMATVLAERGDRAQALASYRKALSVDEVQLAADPKDVTANTDVAEDLMRIGDLLLQGGDSTGALESFRKATNLLELVAAAQPMDVEQRNSLAEAYCKMGLASARLPPKAGEPAARWREARAWYEKSRSVRIDLRSRGFAEPAASDIDAAEIRKCDAAFAKLKDPVAHASRD